MQDKIGKICSQSLERSNRSENMGQVLELLPSRRGKVIV